MIKRLAFTIIAVLWLCAPASAYTLVQANGGAAFGPQTAETCTFSSPVTAGNTVVVAWALDNAITDIYTAVDNAIPPNTYNVGPTSGDNSGSRGLEIIWLGNVQNAPTAIVVTSSVARNNLAILCEEWSGVNASANPSDVAPLAAALQASPGTGTNGIVSSSITTVTNGDLLLGYTADRTGTTCPTSAGTTSITYALKSQSTTFNNAVSCIQSEAGTQSTAGAGTVAAYTQGTNNPAATTILALKPPGGGSPTCGARMLIGVGC